MCISRTARILFTKIQRTISGLLYRLPDIINEFVLFQYSDMRWGIQSHADNDHSTEDMCFQELDRCCRLSLATNCVVSCVPLAKAKTLLSDFVKSSIWDSNAACTHRKAYFPSPRERSIK
jgi:hypothetical protein